MAIISSEVLNLDYGNNPRQIINLARQCLQARGDARLSALAADRKHAKPHEAAEVYAVVVRQILELDLVLGGDLLVREALSIAQRDIKPIVL